MDKFRAENIKEAIYENFELVEISDIRELILSDPEIKGLNVTIPYKQSVMKYIDVMDSTAKRVGAVNVIKKLENGKLKGYNSDYYGFRISLENWVSPHLRDFGALVLGTGGAAKAVIAVLEDCNIDFLKVSRSPGKENISYFDIRQNSLLLGTHKLIINTTPLGMYPRINEMPNLPYEKLNEDHYLYDLIYNPEKTLFLQQGELKGAKIKNGSEMLILQAERSWQIWNNKE